MIGVTAKREIGAILYNSEGQLVMSGDHSFNFEFAEFLVVVDSNSPEALPEGVQQ